MVKHATQVQMVTNSSPTSINYRNSWHRLQPALKVIYFFKCSIQSYLLLLFLLCVFCGVLEQHMVQKNTKKLYLSDHCPGNILIKNIHRCFASVHIFLCKCEASDLLDNLWALTKHTTFYIDISIAEPNIHDYNLYTNFHAVIIYYCRIIIICFLCVFFYSSFSLQGFYGRHFRSFHIWPYNLSLMFQSC